jgi:hypothetical protein
VKTRGFDYHRLQVFSGHLLSNRLIIKRGLSHVSSLSWRRVGRKPRYRRLHSFLGSVPQYSNETADRTAISQTAAGSRDCAGFPSRRIRTAGCHQVYTVHSWGDK